MNNEKPVSEAGTGQSGEQSEQPLPTARRRAARKKKPKALRLFIGLGFPLHDKLAPLTEDLRKLAQDEPTLRISAPRNLHVTLKFLGTVKPEQVDEIHALCASVCARYPQLEVSSQGIGLFKNSLWVGINHQETLSALAAEMNAAGRLLGFADDEKDFVPHVTVARFGKDARAKLLPLLEKFQTAEWGSFTARKCYLYQSETLQEGARYFILRGYSFTSDGAESGVTESPG